MDILINTHRDGELTASFMVRLESGVDLQETHELFQSDWADCEREVRTGADSDDDYDAEDVIEAMRLQGWVISHVPMTWDVILGD